MPDASTLFRQRFGCPATHLVQAPGWLALLGGATQHQEGLVLTAALNRSIQIASAPRTDGKIELVYEAPANRELFWVDELKSTSTAAWANQIKRVLEQLHRRQAHFKGFNAAIVSGLDCGLESGAPTALAVATALTVRQLYPFRLTETGLAAPPIPNAKGQLPALSFVEKVVIAKLCRAALGEASGLLGPLSCLWGKAWHLMSIDLRFLTVEHLPLVGEGLVFCRPQFQAAAEAQPAMEDFDLLSQIAVQKLGLKSLRSMEPQVLEANRARLTPEEYSAARFIVAENQRVVAAERALRENDHAQFGQYLFQSRESVRQLFGSSSKELVALLERARLNPSCLGARIENQTLVSLVQFHHAESFVKLLAGPIQFESRICHAADGT